jgi:Ca-activated chloride channel family protein
MQRRMRGRSVKRHIRIIIWLTAACLCFFYDLHGQNQRLPREPLFKIAVENVFLRVSVIDSLNRFVTGLEKEHFKVYEDKVEQNISYFNQEPAPISVGILFDVSSSMKEHHNIRKAKNSITQFLKSGHPEDDYFLITFNEVSKLAHDYTGHSESIQNEVAFQKPGGETALYDAVYMGMDRIERGRNDKKALILITDGEDNSSRYSPSEVREFVKESDTQIYAIGHLGNLAHGRSYIQEIVDLAGGRAFFPNSFSELDYYVDLIHSELRNQYILGYEPTNKAHDGRWRRIRIKLDAPKGLPKLKIFTREGYYAPKN